MYQLTTDDKIQYDNRLGPEKNPIDTLQQKTRINGGMQMTKVPKTSDSILLNLRVIDGFVMGHIRSDSDQLRGIFMAITWQFPGMQADVSHDDVLLPKQHSVLVMNHPTSEL